MFWGLIMEPKRRYTQTVKRPFHISMAALDIFSADDEPTQLMLFFQQRNYLLCTLQKGQTVQCPLDLNFETGDEVVFATNGNSNIHLSGFLQDQFDDDIDESLEESEEVEEELEPTQKKKKNIPQNEPPSKKSKLSTLLDDDFDSNDEEDESFHISQEIDDDSDEDIDEEEDDEDEEDEDMEANESDDDDEEEEEVPVEVPKPKMNGEKAKKNKLQNESKKKDKPKNEIVNAKQDEKSSNISKQSPQQKRTMEGGVITQELKVGDGAIAKSGKVVQVYYEGRLKQNNKLFDQTTKGAGFKFRLGKQEVIKAWDIGVVGMKVGGRRRITCPPAMAYGQKGSPPAIPPNSTLIFEVELKNVI